MSVVDYKECKSIPKPKMEILRKHGMRKNWKKNEGDNVEHWKRKHMIKKILLQLKKNPFGRLQSVYLDEKTAGVNRIDTVGYKNTKEKII